MLGEPRIAAKPPSAAGDSSTFLTDFRSPLIGWSRGSVVLPLRFQHDGNSFRAQRLVPGLKLFDIKCAWFNEEEHCEFFPRTLIVR